jgi:hypothetical protein
MTDDNVITVMDHASAAGELPALSVILDEVEAFVCRYIVLDSHQAAAVALWIAHTWVQEAADATPYIALTSAVRQSGKTRALDVLGMLVRSPIYSANMTAPVLFRTVDAGPATLLMDELDAIFGRREGNEELRGLLNAGYQRGGQVQRCEIIGKKIEVRSYSVFAPKCFAAIGTLPDTIADRSIHIRMRRKTPEEKVDRFRRRLVRDEATRIANWLDIWSASALAELADAWPVLPDALDDRGQDAWEPLLAIADLASGGWDGRARLAAVHLADAKEDATETASVLLLTHLREIIGDREKVPTTDLLHELIDRDDGPWPSWWANEVEAGKTKGPGSKLARLLKPFNVHPVKYRVDESTTVRGYERAAFEEAWRRYAPYTPR